MNQTNTLLWQFIPILHAGELVVADLYEFVWFRSHIFVQPHCWLYLGLDLQAYFFLKKTCIFILNDIKQIHHIHFSHKRRLEKHTAEEDSLC